MRRLMAVGFLWLMASVSVHAGPWSAVCIQAISFGQTASGQLVTSDCGWSYTSAPNDRYLTDVYSFVGSAGQQISIALSSPAFDTYLELYNVNEISAVPIAPGGSGGTNSRIPANSDTYPLPASGTYYIWVQAASPNVTGAYTLALSGAGGGTGSSRTTVQKAYVSYYGRPGDPAGLDYWVSRMNAQGGSLDAIIKEFGNSAEFTGRYGGVSNKDLVTKIYQQTLARDPDSAGLAYYVGELNAGRRTLQTITLDVLNGATTAPDSTTVANKLAVADYYTAKVSTGCSYGSELTGVGALTPVTAVSATVTAAQRDAIDTRCAGFGVLTGYSADQARFIIARGFPHLFQLAFVTEQLDPSGHAVPLAPAKRVESWAYNDGSFVSALFHNGFFMEQTTIGSHITLQSTNLRPSQFYQGMTEAQVQALLGQPSCVETQTYAGRSLRYLRYRATTDSPVATVAMENGQLIGVTAGYALVDAGDTSTDICAAGSRVLGNGR